NVTNDENISDNFIDINKHTNISFNKISINTTALPNFNVSATLYLYNLTFTNPRILRDDSVCSSSICTKESYSNGILKFNVTGSSTYTAEETPTEAETPSSIGGGGSGGCNYQWSCTKWNDCLPNGKQKRDCVNIGSCPNRYKIPEKEKQCTYVSPSADEALFDVIVSPLDKEIFSKNREVSFRIRLIKFGAAEQLSPVRIIYTIHDDKAIFKTEQEELDVQKEVSFIKTIAVPALPAGVYQFDVVVQYDNKAAEGKTSFFVRDSTETPRKTISLIVIVTLFIILIFLIYLKFFRRSYLKNYKKKVQR
ncbi:MAG: hypothetical protein RL557_808, partial [archaeon]